MNSLQDDQIWFNHYTKQIYISVESILGFIMDSALGGFFMDQEFINNIENGWVYIGDLQKRNIK